MSPLKDLIIKLNWVFPTPDIWHDLTNIILRPLSGRDLCPQPNCTQVQCSADRANLAEGSIDKVHGQLIHYFNDSPTYPQFVPCGTYRNTFTHLCKESGLKQAIFWNCIIFGCYFTYCKSSEIHCKNLEPLTCTVVAWQFQFIHFVLQHPLHLLLLLCFFFRRCSFFKRGKHKAFKKVWFF